MSLEETLKMNKFKTRATLEEQKKQNRKKEKKEQVILLIAMIVITILIVYFINTCNKMLDSSISSCINLGYTQDYCYKKLA